MNSEVPYTLFNFKAHHHSRVHTEEITGGGGEQRAEESRCQILTLTLLQGT
jgi:hypothetical protein